jgi:hypothetical protein
MTFHAKQNYRFSSKPATRANSRVHAKEHYPSRVRSTLLCAEEPLAPPHTFSR